MSHHRFEKFANINVYRNGCSLEHHFSGVCSKEHIKSVCEPGSSSKLFCGVTLLFNFGEPWMDAVAQLIYASRYEAPKIQFFLAHHEQLDLIAMG